MMSEVNNTDKLEDIEEVKTTDTEVTPTESLAEEPVHEEVQAEPIHEEVQPEVQVQAEQVKEEPIRETPVVQEPVNPAVTQPVSPAPAPVVEKKKTHPGLMLLACAAIGLASGFGGGYLAVSQFGKGEPEVEIQEVPVEQTPVG